jgi:hypothetical protein
VSNEKEALMPRVDQVSVGFVGPEAKSQFSDGQSFAEVVQRDPKRLSPSSDVRYPWIKVRIRGGEKTSPRLSADSSLKLSSPDPREAAVASCTGSGRVREAAMPLRQDFPLPSGGIHVDGYPNVSTRNSGRVLQGWARKVVTFAGDFFRGKVATRENIGAPSKNALLAGAGGLVLVSAGAAYYWYNRLNGQYIPVDPGRDAPQPVASAQAPRARSMSV